MQTIYNNTVSSTLLNVDEFLVCEGKKILYKTRFGIGSEEVDLEKYFEISILRESMCMPICINEGMLAEIINTKIKE